MTQVDPVDAVGETTAGAHDTEDLYENSPIGYVSTAPDGTIVRANQTFVSWLGYPAQDLIGAMRFQDLLTTGGRIFYETHYAPLLRMQGSVREIAVEFRCANGRTLPALVNSNLRRDDEGQPVMIRTAVFPATERREYERELLRARVRAEESEERARSLAQTLQATFVPPTPPHIPGADLAAVYRPAGDGSEVGGDFYDVFETGLRKWGVIIGDVCGKGAEAATITALARYTIRAAAVRSKRPSVVLRTLNDALLQNGSDRFCTALYATIREGSSGVMRLSLACGGHPLPLHVDSFGMAKTVARPGDLLGVLEKVSLSDVSIDAAPGDLLVFYTDGVLEGRNGNEFYGFERLRDVAVANRSKKVEAVAHAIAGDVVAFQNGRPRDDIALLVLKVQQVPSGGGSEPRDR